MEDKEKEIRIKGPLTKNGSLKVELVPMPSGDNPWRTRKDYLNEQRKDTIRYYIILFGFVLSVFSATFSWMQVTEAKKERIKAEIALKEAKEAKESVKQTATILLKISHIFADGGGRFGGGMPEEHMNRIQELERELNILDENHQLEIQKELEEINESINKKNKNTP